MRELFLKKMLHKL